MSPRLPKLLTVACCASVAIVATALAAPSRTATLSADATSYKWDGSGVSGGPIVAVSDDDTLVELKVGGTLTATITDNGDTSPLADLDLYLYKADSAGETSGDALVSSEEAGNDEKVSKSGLDAGFYVVRVSAFTGVEEGYAGTATLVPSGGGATPTPTPSPGATATPTPGPGATPTPGAGGGAGADVPPEARIAKLARKARAKKLKSFRGTATDDRGVARVEIAVVKKRGKKCTQMGSSGRFSKLGKCAAPTSFVAAKGTTKWTYKLRKRLKKGRYTLFARAIDTAGQRQGGFSSANRRGFRVK